MVSHSHDVYQYGLPVLALAVSRTVFWPYFAGAAILGIGLTVGSKNRFHEVRSLEKLITLGPLLFAMGMAIFGADHLVAAKFVALIVPSWMPGRLFWAYFVGLALIAAALSLATKRYWHLASASLGIMIFLFVLLIHLPNWIKAPYNSVRLTMLLRDLALSAGALAFSTLWTEPKTEQPSGFKALQTMAPPLVTVARFLIAIAITVFGVDHFLNPTFAPGIPQENQAVFVTMPPWVPAHTFWAYVTGVIFIVCGLGMMSKQHARFAASVVGLTILVLIFVVYIPLTLSRASNIANGLNYLAIHFALAGTAFLLAEALPATASEPTTETAEGKHAMLKRAG